MDGLRLLFFHISFHCDIILEFSFLNTHFHQSLIDITQNDIIFQIIYNTLYTHSEEDDE